MSHYHPRAKQNPANPVVPLNWRHAVGLRSCSGAILVLVVALAQGRVF
jgi:ABC-type nickel/cobalt efflux system permease component RcnA